MANCTRNGENGRIVSNSGEVGNFNAASYIRRSHNMTTFTNKRVVIYRAVLRIVLSPIVVPGITQQTAIMEDVLIAQFNRFELS